jgi:hypothetical protein
LDKLVSDKLVSDKLVSDKLVSDKACAPAFEKRPQRPSRIAYRYLVDIKVSNYRVEAGIQVVQEIHHLKKRKNWQKIGKKLAKNWQKIGKKMCKKLAKNWQKMAKNWHRQKIYFCSLFEMASRCLVDF